MPVVEAPTFHDWPVLAHTLAHGEHRYGQFVFFRLDPLASVAVLDDAKASRAAALLPQDWFLGIVIQNGTLGIRNAKGRALLNFNVYLLGEGPADPVSAAIPISPAPQLANNHPPIQLDAELPWPNLYAHSFYSVIAVISRIHDGPDQFPVALTAEQTAAFVNLATHDQDHRYDAVRKERAKQAEAREPIPAPVVEDSDSASDSESIASYDFMLTAEAQAITRKFISRNEYGELWLDPASCPGQPASPSACLEVLNRLGAIGREWYERKIEEAKHRRPQLIREWTQTVGDAGADMPPDHDPSYESSLSPDDDDVRPEDAVDYRVECERSERLPNCAEKLPLAGLAPRPAVPPTTRTDGETDQPHTPPPVAGPTGPTEDDATVPISKSCIPEESANVSAPHGVASIRVVGDRLTSARRTSMVRNRVASVKRAAVHLLRSLVARPRARTVRYP